jgi:hypothetical protein
MAVNSERRGRGRAGGNMTEEEARTHVIEQEHTKTKALVHMPWAVPIKSRLRGCRTLEQCRRESSA